MGIMDQVRSGISGGGSTPFLTGDEKDAIVARRQPFNILAIRHQQTSNFGPKWYLDILFLNPDTMEAVVVDDGEGGEEMVTRTLSLGSNSYRDQEMAGLQALLTRYVADGYEGGVGPLTLAKRAVKGQVNKAYVLEDYSPTGGATVESQPSAPPPPPPPAEIISEDGKFKWTGSAWVPNAPPPPAAPAVVDALPFSGAAGGSAQAPSASAPALGKSQPIPEGIRVIGGDGEGGQAETVHYPGDKIRQVVYQGEGVVQTPQGGLVKLTHDVPPPPPPTEDVSQVAEAVGVEPVEPPPAEKPKARGTVPVEVVCPSCNKKQKGQAFRNSKGNYIIAHTCEQINPATGKRVGSMTIDVNDMVRSILGDE